MEPNNRRDCRESHVICSEGRTLCSDNALRRKDAGFLFGAQALHRVYLGCAARECQNSERCHGKNE